MIDRLLCLDPKAGGEKTLCVIETLYWFGEIKRNFPCTVVLGDPFMRVESRYLLGFPGRDVEGV